ncbi:GNAT family N-acetyltransferase [Rathayibacter sp. KR2-224]|uniref:GNAT family N-acetyltransferase n=1 Tax=Rathayibacter sp. KR2-224 TaxID=3400913 RepID=UPI003C0B6499
MADTQGGEQASVSIRRATPADALGIARVHVRSWREAYGHVFSPFLLGRLSVESRAERWRRMIIAGAEVWVAELVAQPVESAAHAVRAAPAKASALKAAPTAKAAPGAVSRIVGWASAGPARDEDGPVQRELHGIYVLRDHHGTGAAQRLLDAALGNSPAFLWVLVDNPRARAFYRRNGFVPDGTTKVDTFGGEPAAELRMVRR